MGNLRGAYLDSRKPDSARCALSQRGVRRSVVWG